MNPEFTTTSKIMVEAGIRAQNINRKIDSSGVAKTHDGMDYLSVVSKTKRPEPRKSFMQWIRANGFCVLFIAASYVLIKTYTQ